MIDTGTLGAAGPTVDRRAGQASHARAHRPRPAASRRFGGVAHALVFSIAGFVLGAIFWHFVGFWSFVSHMVLKGPEEQIAAQRETTARVQRTVKEAGRLKDSPQAKAFVPLVPSVRTAPEVAECAALSLDRKTGRVDQVPCYQLAHELPQLASARADQLPLPPASAMTSSWSVQVDAADTPTR